MDPGADDEAAMAQLMGFSAFGATQNKKRKYNPNADAATGAQPRQPQGSAPRASTGSNATPLGQAQRREAGHEATASATNTDEIDLDLEGDSGSTAAAQADTTLPVSAPVRPAGLPERPSPPFGLVGSPFSEPLPGQQRHDRQPNDDPSRGPWYEGYYDPSSNENPWDRLEKAMQLPPKGTWVFRGKPTTMAATAT